MTKKEENIQEEKNLWGRPLKYTPEELFSEAQKYFKHCEEVTKNSDYKILKPKTLSGLCLWLWVDKEYISEKAKDERFSVTIKKIRLEVENNIEEWILWNRYNTTAWIFNLKNNFDWKDKSEVQNDWEIVFKIKS